jgi:RNA polymerase sigma-70 factor (ECF subfamily)
MAKMNQQNTSAAASSSNQIEAAAREEQATSALMQRYVDGDTQAFNELYARCAGQLLAFLIRLTRDRDRAEDLLQTTFAKVHRARDTYLKGAPVLPWLYAIARRTFYDAERSRRARHESLSRDGVLPDLAARGTSSKIELPHALDRALAGLPTAYREALLLTKFFGYSGDEAAAALGTTRAAIKVRVHRANQQLREDLAAA